MKYNKLFIFVLFLCGILYLPQISLASESWPADDGVEISDELLADSSSFEPSGLVWHEGRDSLFTVWAGLIYELDENGTILHECYSADVSKDWNCGTYYDFEGVTVADLSSDYIYLGVESPDSILEFNINTGEYTGKSWDLTTWMTGSDNQGLEGLTFIPNEYTPDYTDSTSGGHFYATLQATGEVFVFDVDTSISGAVSKIDSFSPTGNNDDSGLFFNSETELLYVMYDNADDLLEIDMDGNILNYYDSLPGSNEEGFAMMPSYPESTTTVFIGHDDSHTITKHANYPVTYPEHPEAPEPKPKPKPEPDPEPDPEPETEPAVEESAEETIEPVIDEPVEEIEEPAIEEPVDDDDIADESFEDEEPAEEVDDPINEDEVDETDEGEEDFIIDVDEDEEELDVDAYIRNKYIYISVDDDVSKIKIFKKNPRKTRVKIFNFYNDETTEIVAIGLHKKKAKIVLLQVDDEYDANVVKKKIVKFKKKKKKRKLKVRLKSSKKRVVFKFNKKKKIYKIGSQGKLKTIK